jgi:hypothetical protein
MVRFPVVGLPVKLPANSPDAQHPRLEVDLPTTLSLDSKRVLNLHSTMGILVEKRKTTLALERNCPSVSFSGGI